jgi:hypothetical protein
VVKVDQMLLLFVASSVYYQVKEAQDQRGTKAVVLLSWSVSQELIVAAINVGFFCWR